MKLNIQNIINNPNFLIKILFLFLCSGHISLCFFSLNLSSYLDYILLFFLILNFNLNKDNFFQFFFILFVIIFFLIRLFFTNIFWDTKYLFISLKMLVFLLLFTSYNTSNFKTNSYLILIKNLFLISALLVISDKFLNLFTHDLVNGILFRPRLIGEINFDIALLIELWLLLKLFFNEYKKYYGYILFFIIIISLSRSGIIAYSLTYFFTIQLKNEKFNFKSLYKNILIILSGISLILLIYYLRDPNLDFKNIDRIQLLTALISIYNTDNFTNLFYGHGVLIQLPYNLCKMFSFYALQTTGNEDNCNPVILFSYYLRSTYEYGIIIMFIVPFLYFKLFLKNFSNYISFLVIIPILSISLAVGGFYNSISIISLLIAKNIFLNGKYKYQNFNNNN